jgi:ABC-2 type transport system ATP-binding protein
VTVFGRDLATEPEAVRLLLGVVFQRPSVDPKLTVGENLRHHARLYGMRGSALKDRCAEMARRLGIEDRLRDRVETLSGGLQRRVELAKGLLHRPRLLLLDEPSTGLDPAARREFTRHLQELRDSDGVTIVLTTHFMEEAERCDQVAIMDEGRLIRVDAPSSLKDSVGGDVVVIAPRDAEALRGRIEERFGVVATLVDGALRVERPRGHEFVRDLVEAFSADVQTVSFGKPTLEDAFIHLTGHQLWGPSEQASTK